MSDDHSFEELLEPAQVAEKLNISVATLRKYSLIIEEVTGNSSYFVRTKQKTRLYSATNITDLHDFQLLSKDSTLTLKEAARQIYAVNNTNKSADLPLDPDNLNQGQVVELLQLLQRTISTQNQAIDTLQKEVKAVQKQNKQLLDLEKKRGSAQLAAPKERQPYQTEFSFDEEKVNQINDNAIVDDELNYELDALNNLDSLATKTQTAEGGSKKDPRSEILAKAVENAEQGQQGQLRTLADMQLPREKKHWWNRLRD